jgi:hypothetical protein
MPESLEKYVRVKKLRKKSNLIFLLKKGTLEYRSYSGSSISSETLKDLQAQDLVS